MPRVELDQRSREASRRLEQIKRLLQPPVRVSHSRFLRLVYVLSLGTAPRRNEAIAGASAAQDHSRSEPQGSRPPPEPDASVLRGLQQWRTRWVKRIRALCGSISVVWAKLAAFAEGHA